VRLREVVEIAARELFDAEETTAYAADLDAQVEAQGVLDTARAVTRLRDELHNELRVEGSGASGNDNGNYNEYVHLDKDDLDDDFDADDLAYLELPTNEEAAEAATEQRALMASYEMQRRDESAWHLMTAERRAVVQQRARHSAHRRNMVAAREASEAAERR
jgi:hypothetical protein